MNDDPAIWTLYLDVHGAHRPVAEACQQAFEQLADVADRAALTAP